MDIKQLERFLVEIEGSSRRAARQDDDLREWATWCIDRILALGGTNADERSKKRLMAAQMRVRRLLAEACGTTSPDELSRDERPRRP